MLLTVAVVSHGSKAMHAEISVKMMKDRVDENSNEILLNRYLGRYRKREGSWESTEKQEVTRESVSPPASVHWC